MQVHSITDAHTGSGTGRYKSSALVASYMVQRVHTETGREQHNMREAARWRDMTPREKIEHDPDLLKEAREHIEQLDIPGTPGVHHSRILKAAGLPDWCGTRQVHNIDITKGDPINGVARSDDHIGYFEVELPFSEIDHDAVWEDVCEECGCDRALYRYRATHFIAGSEHVWCPECETKYYEEEWG